MMTTLQPATTPGVSEATRPLYLRRIPESIWVRVHVNAITSGLRLQEYLTLVMAECQPIPRDQTHETT